ncbi:MAG: hypothetical protein JJE47_07020 [Acidimicrobiia bacterium]|nr:hypothetical protein [Acidimicrobiia bacterium]
MSEINNPGSPTTQVEDRPPRLTWVRAFWFIVILVFFVAALDRFLEWDEAVFFSQSGGLDGNPSRPNWFAASREMGPPLVIAALRLTGLDLAQVRIAWAVLAIALSIVVFRSLGRHVGRSIAMASLLTLWTFWLTLAFSGSFYGSLFAGLFSVLAISTYLTVRTTPGWRNAALFGIAISGALAMRQLESVIVTCVIVGHSLVVRPSLMWRDRIKESLTAVAIFIGAFVIPWVGLSIRQYGSVGERLRLLKEQAAGLPSGWTWGLDDYVRVIGGGTQSNTPFAPLPTWPLTGMALALTALAVLAMFGRGSDRSSRQAILLTSAVAGALVAFFTLRYATVEVRDRYVTMVAPLAAVLVGWLWSRSMHGLSSRPKWIAPAALGSILVLWLASQLALAIPYENNRDSLGEANLRVGSTMQVIASSGDCVAVSRFGAPEIQAASGCSVTRMTDEPTAITWAEDIEKLTVTAFILWPGPADTLDLPGEWTSLETRVGRTSRTLYYFKPDR